MDDRRSLHSLQSSSWHSFVCLALLFANCGVVLFSHIALALQIETNLSREAVDAANLCEQGRRSLSSLRETYTPEITSGVSFRSSLRKTSHQRGLTAGTTNRCNATDAKIWQEDGKLFTLQTESTCGLGCGAVTIQDGTCYSECMSATRGYSAACATCFGEKGTCAAGECFLECLPPNQLSHECELCTIEHCGFDGSGEFGLCHGMGFWTNGTVSNTSNTSNISGTRPSASTVYVSVGDVGELAFFNAVEYAWEGKAYALAILVVVASGINPYLENILLMVSIFAPLSRLNRQRLLWWINRFGRWTFMDVFCICIVLCAVNFRTMGGDVHVRSRSKPGIYAFAFATIWARIQGACIEVMQHRSDPDTPGQEQKRCIPTPTPLFLRVWAGLSLVLLLISIFAPSYEFLVIDPLAGNKKRSNEYSALALGVEQGPSDGAEVLGPIFMAFTYYTFAMVLPVGRDLALLVAPGNPWVLQAVDYVGSASSMDVLVLSAAIIIPYYKQILEEATDCWTREGDPPAVQADASLLWGFWFGAAYAVSSLVSVEMVSLARNRQPQSAIHNQSTAKAPSNGDAKGGIATQIGVAQQEVQKISV